jgi:chemotaxis response regulator CheB
MATHDIVVIGASAGGVIATRTLLGMLPADLPAAVFVVIHRRTVDEKSEMLLRVLSRGVQLPVRAAVDGSRFSHGEVIVAPADSHLIVGRGVVQLEQSPREQLARPSIDVLFRSAATVYGRRVVGVVLSGMLTDGSAGLWHIRKHGGVAIAQDPEEAEFGSMPRSALEHVPLTSKLRLVDIGPTLVHLCATEGTPPPLSGTRSARILIVEDERIVALELANRLQALGYVIVGSVSTGEDALRIVEDVEPDLVLMDVLLAGRMRGTGAAKALWDRYQLPVVYLTAYSDTRTLDEANQSMPYGYIVKPYRPEQIEATLQLALARRERELDRL